MVNTPATGAPGVPRLVSLGQVWPMAAKASPARHLATGGRRRVDLASAHYAGPAVLITMSMALQLIANFL